MKQYVILATLVATLVGCQSTSNETPATTTTNDTGNYSALAGVALTAAMQAWGQQSTGSTPLVDSVQQATNVTAEQAVGGVGSLLALAQNSLNTTQNTELESLIPGYNALSSTGLSSMITNSTAVTSAFSALGLDPTMVSAFAPIILNSLQSQGASSTLLSALGTIWQ